MFKSEIFSIAIILGIFFICVTHTFPMEHYPYGYNRRTYENDLEEADPKMMFAILAKLGQTIIKASEAENDDDIFSSKRGLDLGLSRGYSGSQQAKHMMGMAAANLSGGPGRKRRSHDFNMYHYQVPQFLLPEQPE